MPVITLTTEWRHDDFYHGIIKGKLSSKCPGIGIIDNAAGIPPFNIARASFIIRNTYNNYPSGTVHIICVHSEHDGDKDHLAVSSRGHYFIGTDNGIFNLILNSEPDEIVKIHYDESQDELEIFASAAAALVTGKTLKDIGLPVKNINEKMPLRATIEKDAITGSIIFIDSYGNALSNITREVFYRVFENKEYKILVQSNRNFIGRISARYNDVPVGDLLARFNQLDLLEIAVNGADVSELLGLNTGSVIRVDTFIKQSLNNRLV
jgi:S-adenosyl-L-methionine hydrolase (adenosine-forming)